MTRKTYYGKQIDVTFDLDVCLHAAECLRRCPEVFDTKKKPWVLPDGAPSDKVAEAVRACPTGALQYRFKKDFLPLEPNDSPTTVVARSAGPLWIRGDVVLSTDEGDQHWTRVALCRCGQTKNAPLCSGAGPCTEWHHPKPEFPSTIDESK
jgi:uncharacterized Fe-S cluster protein YjdI/CDGSH-type Zn-finger protein